VRSAPDQAGIPEQALRGAGTASTGDASARTAGTATARTAGTATARTATAAGTCDTGNRGASWASWASWAPWAPWPGWSSSWWSRGRAGDGGLRRAALHGHRAAAGAVRGRRAPGDRRDVTRSGQAASGQNT
jgi:hypothetical protein